jgi:hypothetical protein
MRLKLVLVILYAIALPGCAQFHDSFGEFWGPESYLGLPDRACCSGFSRRANDLGSDMNAEYEDLSCI